MKYDAFISYRHCELDMYVAKKIHKGLETFKVPRSVAKKTGKKSIKRVFRDQEELPIGSDLGDNIKHALQESEYLVVICSPRTKESYWVMQEIDTFIAMHGRERVLAVLIEGEPADSFPVQILTDDKGNPVEPLAADVRGLSRKQIDKKIKAEIMRLAAPIIGCTYDDLRQRHRERRMRKLIFATSGVAVLGLAFGAYSTYNAKMIRENYEQKQANQSKYLASTSLELLEAGDRQAAALIALEALPSADNDRPFVAEAQYALSEALYCYDIGSDITMDRVLKHELPVVSFSYNKAGDKIISVDEGCNVYVWQVADGALLTKILPEVDDEGRVLTPNGVALYEDNILINHAKQLLCLNLSGEVNWKVEAGDAYWMDFLLEQNTGTIACVSNTKVTFYEADSGKEIGSINNSLEKSFVSTFTFNDSGNQFAVAHLGELFETTDVTGYVSVYDFVTKKVTVCETVHDSVTDMDFTADGDLVVGSLKGKDLSDASATSQGIGCVEKINVTTGESYWQSVYEYNAYVWDGGVTQLKTREYQDATGKIQKEVILSENQTVHTWDEVDGRLKTRTNAGGGIVTLLISGVSELAYLAENTGIVRVVNLDTGIVYNDYNIEFGRSIKEVAVRNNVWVARSYASPELVVMKRHEGSGKKVLNTYESSIKGVYSSAEETYYAVRIQESYDCEIFHFYCAEDDSVVVTLEDNQGKSLIECGFMDEERFLRVYSDGTVSVYNVKSGENKNIQTVQDAGVMEGNWQKETGKILIYSGSEMHLVDGDSLKEEQSYDVGEYIFSASLGVDGNTIYCNLKESGLVEIDVAKNELMPIDLEGNRMSYCEKPGEGLCVSKDGKWLVVSCADATLRILNAETKEIVDRVPFAAVTRKYIGFSEDGTKILLQGDDYYFKVYDLEEKEFIYVSGGQYYSIDRIIFNAEAGEMSLITSSDMVILDSASYQRIAQVEKGVAYLPASGAVFNKDDKTLCRFPYMTLPMLLEEVKVQFGDVKLTQSEKTQFFVD
ncbi:MAG: toll/interleukin-1 receptor domain-containing protein [Lachnospiraceae bacterium]|nr:toll/interleukin-1 receptor domain-containing protein [Lachnospiraceae bacterium]